jgi:hypothetical protein
MLPCITNSFTESNSRLHKYGKYKVHLRFTLRKGVKQCKARARETGDHNCSQHKELSKKHECNIVPKTFAKSSNKLHKYGKNMKSNFVLDYTMRKVHRNTRHEHKHRKTGDHKWNQHKKFLVLIVHAL